MLNQIEFRSVPPAASLPRRRDVVCFIGYVKRRTGSPVPQGILDQLQGSGWPMPTPNPSTRERLSAERLHSLLNLPVVVESWSLFDQLFAWQRRPVRAGSEQVCATYLGAAVRSFFRGGGRRAVVVRVGDPWPFLDSDRPQQVSPRLRRLLPSLGHDAAGEGPHGRVLEPLRWEGIELLHGLPEVSHVCLPDLSDCCAHDPQVLRPAPRPAPTPEVFVDCGGSDSSGSAAETDRSLIHLELPRLDLAGFHRWRDALAETTRFLEAHRRDTLFIGHLPQSQHELRAGQDGVHAASDPDAFFAQSGIWGEEPSRPSPDRYPSPAEVRTGIESALVQLGWPWLRGPTTVDLPAHGEPPDGVLAGRLARNALERGTHRTIAGSRVDGVAFLEPVPSVEGGYNGPMDRLAERICLIGPTPSGFRLVSDVTTSSSRSWRAGGVSRMMSSLLKEARRAGESVTFEPNGPVTWALIRRRLESLLRDWWGLGALGGRTSAEAYRVRCDRSTMSQADLDSGRIRAEVGVLPAHAVERITVVLDLQNGAVQLSTAEVAP